VLRSSRYCAELTKPGNLFLLDYLAHWQTSYGVVQTARIRKRILIVDDDASVRSIVRRGLEHQLGSICEEAENGLDGIAKAKTFRADLIILDLAMPVMNGFETAMVLQREMRHVPVVILSMYAHDHFGATLQKIFGVRGIIPKDEGINSLIERIQKILTHEV
jgi:DNA-binding NarL/FixJ family response regulator